MSTAVTTMESTVLSFENGFNQVNAYKLNFKKEANFALQILKGNDFLRGVAQKNPDSLQNAITNIAAIGISLNPASKEAYLVPRGGIVCLDVSYIGLANLATKDGHLLWVQAEIVKKNDKFKYLGVGKAPIHEMDPFGDRGEIVGVYCVGKTTTNEFLCTIMTKLECDTIREKCSKGSTSWKDFYEEMLKKTVIKRASKLWPKSERLDAAIEVLNQHEGIEFGKPGPHVDPSAFLGEAPTEDVFAQLRKILAAKGRSEEQLLKYLNTQFHDAKLEKLEDLNSAQIEYSYRMLGGKS